MKSKDMIPTVLVVAGSDPTGGAGIQADLKTLTALGVYGAAAITCITVQNSQGVSRVEPVVPDLVGQQMQAVLAEHRVTHIKIGMIGTANIAKAVESVLQTFQGEVVYDPVLASTTGQDLLEPEALSEIKQHLLSQVTVLTPNLPELSALTGRKVSEKEELHPASQAIFARYPALKCIIAKGGHGRTADGLLTDYCFLRREHQEVQHGKVSSRNTHGTGCTLASAFCAYHIKTTNYAESFMQAVKYVQQLLATSSRHKVIHTPDGKGPMLHALLPTPH